MRIFDLGEREISRRPLAAQLAEAWGIDNMEWGAAVTNVIEQRRIRSTILSVNMATLCFEWAGPSLTFLDENPARLFNAPITALRDQRFVQGIIEDLCRATAASRPYLCRIETLLNGVEVDYEILSLPIHNPRAGTIVSCMRIPLDLTVYGPPPVGFDPARNPLKTSFRSD